MMKSLDALLAQSTFSPDDLLQLLKTEDPAECEALYAEAFRRTTAVHGNCIYFRGLIEISNVCVYDCRYCGIRKSNRAARRYTLTRAEILEAARYALATARWRCKAASAATRSSWTSSRTSARPFTA